jgi:hypothetical protein
MTFVNAFKKPSKALSIKATQNKPVLKYKNLFPSHNRQKALKQKLTIINL